MPVTAQLVWLIQVQDLPFDQFPVYFVQNGLPVCTDGGDLSRDQLLM